MKGLLSKFSGFWHKGIKQKVICIVVVLFVLMGCSSALGGSGSSDSSGSSKSADGISVKISKTDLSLSKGKTAVLKAQASNKSSIVWSSKNASIASVGSDGKVTAEKAGTTEIVATSSDKKASASCKVTVKVESFEAGMYKVGKEIPAGEYTLVVDGSLGGYFAITKDSSGKLSSIKANDNFTTNSIVSVKNGEYLEVKNAVIYHYGDVKIDTTGNGMFKVGKDIKAGEYKIVAEDTATGYGYVEVSKNAKHILSSIITNDNFTGNKYIKVKNGQYLKLSGAHIKK